MIRGMFDDVWAGWARSHLGQNPGVLYDVMALLERRWRDGRSPQLRNPKTGKWMKQGTGIGVGLIDVREGGSARSSAPAKQTPETASPSRIEQRSVESLSKIAYPNQALNEAHVELLAEKYRKDGYTGEPVQVEQLNNGELMTDGHHRLEAAKRAGIEEIPAQVYANTPEGSRAATRAIVDAERQKSDDYDPETELARQRYQPGSFVKVKQWDGSTRGATVSEYPAQDGWGGENPNVMKVRFPGADNDQAVSVDDVTPTTDKPKRIDGYSDDIKRSQLDLYSKLMRNGRTMDAGEHEVFEELKEWADGEGIEYDATPLAPLKRGTYVRDSEVDEVYEVIGKSRAARDQGKIRVRDAFGEEYLKDREELVPTDQKPSTVHGQTWNDSKRRVFISNLQGKPKDRWTNVDERQWADLTEWANANPDKVDEPYVASKVNSLLRYRMGNDGRDREDFELAQWDRLENWAKDLHDRWRMGEVLPSDERHALERLRDMTPNHRFNTEGDDYRENEDLTDMQKRERFDALNAKKGNLGRRERRQFEDLKEWEAQNPRPYSVAAMEWDEDYGDYTSGPYTISAAGTDDAPSYSVNMMEDSGGYRMQKFVGSANTLEEAMDLADEHNRKQSGAGFVRTSPDRVVTRREAQRRTSRVLELSKRRLLKNDLNDDETQELEWLRSWANRVAENQRRHEAGESLTAAELEELEGYAPGSTVQSVSGEYEVPQSLKDDIARVSESLPKTFEGWDQRGKYRRDSNGNVMPGDELLRHEESVRRVGEGVRKTWRAAIVKDQESGELRDLEAELNAAVADRESRKERADAYRQANGFIDLLRTKARLDRELDAAEASGDGQAIARLDREFSDYYVKKEEFDAGLAEIVGDFTEQTANENRLASRIESRKNDILLDMMRQVRPMGGSVVTAIKDGPDKDSLDRWVKGASVYFPSEWIGKSNSDHGAVRVIRTDRGYYSHGMNTLAISGSDRFYEGGFPDYYTEVAAHELGHRMERTIPGLTALEFAMQRRRGTRDGGDLEDRTLMRVSTDAAGRGREEWSHADNWGNSYVGRTYESEGNAGDPAAEAWEVFQTGIQDLFSRSSGMTNSGDEELRDLTLGALLTLG